MVPPLSRRGLLALPLAGVLLPRPVAGDGRERTVRTYEANIGVLFDLLTFGLSGTVTEEVDRALGRYRVTMAGTGPGLTASSEAIGIIRDGRFQPLET